MDTGLKMLILASLLTVGLALIASAAVVLYGGLRYAAGNRDQPASLPLGEDAPPEHIETCSRIFRPSPLLC